MLTDYSLPPLNGGETGRAVLFLHGVGDSGQGGLLSIGGLWQEHLPPDTEFLCPDGPMAFDMAPTGRQWFSLKDFSPWARLEGTKMAAPFLNDYIDNVMTSRNLRESQIALVGFSQGTIMSLYVAPRREKPVAGVIGYSGVLIGGDSLPAEKKCAPPTLLVHGTADEVLPYSFMKPSEQGLKAAGIPVETLTCPGIGHTIDEAGLEAGLRFLQKVLA
jgi:phospholipase/carboxylesterase